MLSLELLVALGQISLLVSLVLYKFRLTRDFSVCLNVSVMWYS